MVFYKETEMHAFLERPSLAGQAELPRSLFGCWLPPQLVKQEASVHAVRGGGGLQGL